MKSSACFANRDTGRMEREAGEAQNFDSAIGRMRDMGYEIPDVIDLEEAMTALGSE
jgi:hypothetical protein